MDTLVINLSARMVENLAYIQKNDPDLIPDIKAGLITIPQAVDRINGREELKRRQEVKAIQAARRAAAPSDRTRTA